MTECINCRNTAAKGSSYCRPCEDAMLGITRRDQRFYELESAIDELEDAVPATKAIKILRNLMRDLSVKVVGRDLTEMRESLGRRHEIARAFYFSTGDADYLSGNHGDRRYFPISPTPTPNNSQPKSEMHSARPDGSHRLP